MLPTGELVPMPCGRTSCPLCSRRLAMITAAMVGIDARDDQPRLVSTFTTRTKVTPALLREASHQIMRQVRDQLGPVRYCHFLEFTTGRSSRSGGIRRPHLHTLWKDAPPEAAPVIEAAAVSVLTRLAGAHRQQCEEIRTAAGATMYVARHHLKESQAPPAEWGPTRRVRPGRGYWSRPSSELRQEAKSMVRDRRVERRILSAIEEAEISQDFELLPDERHDVVEEAIAAAAAVKVVRVCNPWEDQLGSATA